MFGLLHHTCSLMALGLTDVSQVAPVRGALIKHHTTTCRITYAMAAADTEGVLAVYYVIVSKAVSLLDLMSA